jgi:hypothetical protein
MTKKGGILVDASIHRHWLYSPKKSRSWKAMLTTNPSMMPNAVHICHIIVRAPRIVFGAHSAAYTGVVEDLAPTANPRANRAMSKLYQESAAAIQNPVTNEMKHEMKMVPRRPKRLFRGAFIQQPINALQRYGAPLSKPASLLTLVLDACTRNY